MKIYAVAYTDAGWCETEFEDRFLGVYLHKEDAEAKLAAVHELFDRDEAMYQYREREVRRLAKEWLVRSGLFERRITVDDLDAYASVARSVSHVGRIDVSDPERDGSNAAHIIAHVESIKTCLNLREALPDWPPKVEWVSPEGDKSDYRVIKLGVDV